MTSSLGKDHVEYVAVDDACRRSARGSTSAFCVSWGLHVYVVSMWGIATLRAVDDNYSGCPSLYLRHKTRAYCVGENSVFV